MSGKSIQNKRQFFAVSDVPCENAFQFLRFACCMIVIYEHAVMLTENPFPCLNLRGIAVKIFFILSGFWVTRSFLQSSTISTYALKRVRKIFPQYAATVILCAVLLFPFSNLGMREYFLNADFFKYLAANLLTLNFLCPTLPGVFGGMILDGSVNGSLWTIKVEIGFYIALPFIVFLIKKIISLSSNTSERYGGGA
ncbi:acyltransferase family protein [Treponema brennaborense]|uniref:acyltransferase family protein n=1 Tax=Treponema brennaborense TaxID=81028 RepID=UPI00068D839A|nr:acyltransferase [Treponema brennaborense]